MSDEFTAILAWIGAFLNNRRSKTSTRDLKNTYSTRSPTLKKEREGKKKVSAGVEIKIKIKLENKLRFKNLNCNEPRTECETGFVSQKSFLPFYTSSQTAVQIHWRISAVHKYTLPDGILACYWNYLEDLCKFFITMGKCDFCELLFVVKWFRKINQKGRKI